MSRITRALAASLSLSLILSAPGLVPYQAVAQTIGAARNRLPTNFVSGPLSNGLGSGIPSSHGLVSFPPAAGLIPSAALIPALSAPAAVATPTQALASLQGGTNALNAAAKTGSTDARRISLDSLFESATARSETLAVLALPAAPDTPHLSPFAARSPASGPRWVQSFRGPNGTLPATSLKRTLSIGFLAAVIPIAITAVSIVVAQLLGYQLHPNYRGPDMAEAPSLLGALALWTGTAVMAPISEEAIFRGGLQGRLSRLSSKLHLGSFVVPALIVSLLFVALHETSDPLLFATRMVHAMILSYVYCKEGILASMAAHGFFNGLLTLSIILSAAHAPLLGLAVAPLAFYFAVRSAKLIRAQEPDVASGKLTPKPLSGLLSILLAALLLLGYFTIRPSIVWPIGAAALFINGMIKLRKKS